MPTTITVRRSRRHKAAAAPLATPSSSEEVHETTVETSSDLSAEQIFALLNPFPKPLVVNVVVVVVPGVSREVEDYFRERFRRPSRPAFHA
jgi:hypothetical protein